MIMDELYHHGIKGMHWYVRRYQNPDGTLTEAGKKRYGKYSEGAERNTNIYKDATNKYKRKMFGNKVAGGVSALGLGASVLTMAGAIAVSPAVAAAILAAPAATAIISGAAYKKNEKIVHYMEHMTMEEANKLYNKRGA